MSEPYRLEISEVLEQFQTDPKTGLDEAEVPRRRERYGKNELVEAASRSKLYILWEQLSGALVVLLIAAAAISAFLGEWRDAVAIGAIVVLNAILGFVQDYRSERAMAALKRMAVPHVKVRRNGHTRTISARDLVPGDVMLLEAGNRPPADGRLVLSSHLRVEEAALTGESEAVEKDARFVSRQVLPLGDRRNMVFMGTVITYGRGEALVTATGMQTELGHIAEMLRAVHAEPTPLERRLDRLGRTLAIVAVVIVAVVFAEGLVRGEPLELMFMTALSMAVAAVPEGLPAVATLTLAIGARDMLRRNALIRRLPAVETLGSVTVICSDKTGTLTENRMTVAIVDMAGHRIDLLEELGRNEGLRGSDTRGWLVEHPALELLLVAGDLCNDADLEIHDDGDQTFEAIGDPTESALVVAASRFGFLKPDLEAWLPRASEVPFDSSRKRMSTVHQVGRATPENQLTDLSAWAAGHPYVVFTKGALGAVLEVASAYWTGEAANPLDEQVHDRIVRANDELAQRGMRVLGVAYRTLDGLEDDATAETIERELVFLGLVGMTDPARPEAAEAVARCKTAGIRPVMITGDHPLTALTIAGELGISHEPNALVGHELESMSAAELRRVVKQVSVYARVAPKHKLRIVEAIQANGEVAAMTGDGVNDAPALKKADIGVAMGITGTDVAKEAADMVLLDDNFATIVNAVEAGRVIYDNLRKFLKYILASNAGELWVMLAAPFLGMPLPLLPLQILWINLVTDGLPGLAMAVEPAERNTMRRAPYPPGESFLARGMGWDILWIGGCLGTVSLAAGWWYWRMPGVDDAYWRTIVFTVLTLSQLGNVLALRAYRDSLLTIGLFSNRFMAVSVSLTVVLQMAVIYLPALQAFFKTAPLKAIDLLICVAVSSIVFWAVELQKWILRRRERAAGARAA